MTIEKFLTNCADFGVIDQYLKTVAKEKIQLEKANFELSECFKSSEKALFSEKGKVTRLENDINSLTRQKNELERSWKSDEDALLERVGCLQKQFDDAKAEIEKLKPKIVPPTKIIETKSGRFTAKNDGTAIDTITGLMWCRFAVGQQWDNGKVIGKPKSVNWLEAIQLANSCNTKKLCGFYGWRIPTNNELNSILDRDYYPKVNTTIFSNSLANRFWTNTSYDSSFAWIVDFNNGTNSTVHVSCFSYVLLVRNA